MRFDHWGYSLIESMAAYQRFWHLKPVGPHRRFCDRVLEGLSERCSDCQGHGVRGNEQVDSWVECKTCDGTGLRLVGTQAQLDAVLAQIRATYPDAIEP